MLTSIFLSLVVLIAPAPETPPESPPMVGFILANYHSEERSTRVIGILAIHDNDQWKQPDLVPSRETMWRKDAVPSIEQQSILAPCVGHTFYGALGYPLIFNTTGIVQFGIISCAQWGLSGTLKGEDPSAPEYSEYMVSSQEPASDFLSRVESGGLPRYEKLVEKAHANILEEAAGGRDPDSETYDGPELERYATPELVEAFQFQLTPRRKGLWVHLKAAYPTDEVTEWEDSWTGHYYGIFSLTGNGSLKKLWRAASVNTERSGDSYDFLGACDANNDGYAEFLLHRSGHEERSYYLYAVRGGKLVEIVNESCGL